MTVTEFKAYVKNVYLGAAQIESAGNIPVGEGVVIARLAITSLLQKEFIDVPKV